ILLNEPPPRGTAAFAQWARKLGLEAAGIRVQAEGTFRLGIGKHDALAYIGDGPFPAARLAELGDPPNLDAGRGFIGLSLGLPGHVPLFRVTGKSFDPWSERGPMRDLSKIAFELSKHGPAVILPQAGTVIGSARFRALLGNLQNLKARP